MIFNTETGQFTYHVLRTEIVTRLDLDHRSNAGVACCSRAIGSTKERIVVFLDSTCSSRLVADCYVRDLSASVGGYPPRHGNGRLSSGALPILAKPKAIDIIG